MGAVSCDRGAGYAVSRVVAGIARRRCALHVACRQLLGSCKGTIWYEPRQGWYVVIWDESYKRVVGDESNERWRGTQGWLVW